MGDGQKIIEGLNDALAMTRVRKTIAYRAGDDYFASERAAELHLAGQALDTVIATLPETVDRDMIAPALIAHAVEVRAALSNVGPGAPQASFADDDLDIVRAIAEESSAAHLAAMVRIFMTIADAKGHGAPVRIAMDHRR